PRARADALSGRLLAAGLGRRYTAPASAIFSRPRIQPRSKRNLVAQTAASTIPRRGDPTQSAPWSICPRFDGAPAWKRRIAPGAAQRGSDHGSRGLFVTPSVGSNRRSDRSFWRQTSRLPSEHRVLKTRRGWGDARSGGRGAQGRACLG